MAKSGIDVILVDGLRRDAFVYSGYSAGACVLAPSLAGLELVDSVDDAAATYPDITFEGLDILDRPVVPHLASPGHPEADAVIAEAAHYDGLGQPYWALRDGQALVIDGTASLVI